VVDAHDDNAVGHECKAHSVAGFHAETIASCSRGAGRPVPGKPVGNDPREGEVTLTLIHALENDSMLLPRNLKLIERQPKTKSRFLRIHVGS